MRINAWAFAISMKAECYDELLRLSRENHAMLEELMGYKRKIESATYRNDEMMRDFVMNMLADLTTNRITGRSTPQGRQ